MLLARELKEVVKHREIARAKRERNAVPVVAIVGDVYKRQGKQITQQHRICMDDIVLEKIEAPAVSYTHLDVYKRQPVTSVVAFSGFVMSQ